MAKQMVDQSEHGQSEHRQVIIVTGASSGIGAATVRYFAHRGWAVVLAARSTETIEQIAGEVEERGGQALAVTTDVTDHTDLVALVEQTMQRFGRIDVLVNNAGQGMMGAVAALDLEKFEQLFHLNVLAPVDALQLVVPIMRKQGHGMIINISSVVETVAVPFMSPYAASKIALSYLTDAARAELDHVGIAVINLLPGSTATAFSENSVRAGGGGGFDLEKLLNRQNGGGPNNNVSPEKVAAAIWQAVATQPRQQYVSGSDHALGVLLRHIPGITNPLFRLGLTRYAPRANGENAPASLTADLRRVGLAAGGIAAIVFAGTQLVDHQAKQNQSFLDRWLDRLDRW